MYRDVGLEEKDSLGEALIKIYENKKDTFIILIDEYDVLIREQVPQELFDEFLGFLNGLFKSDTLRPAISLAYLTGLLKVNYPMNDESTLRDAGCFFYG